MADHLGDGAALLLGDGSALLGHGVHVLGLPHCALLSPAAGGRHGGRGGDRHWQLQHNIYRMNPTSKITMRPPGLAVIQYIQPVLDFLCKSFSCLWFIRHATVWRANYLHRVIYSLLDAHTIQFRHINNQRRHYLGTGCLLRIEARRTQRWGGRHRAGGRHGDATWSSDQRRLRWGFPRNTLSGFCYSIGITGDTPDTRPSVTNTMHQHSSLVLHPEETRN